VSAGWRSRRCGTRYGAGGPPAAGTRPAGSAPAGGPLRENDRNAGRKGEIRVAVTGRVLVPWPEIASAVAGLGLDVELFTGEQPYAGGLDDVVFFTVPYDQPFATEPLARMPNVAVVQALTAGYDNLLGLVPSGAALCNARGLHDASTAEHALALILAAQRELPRWARAQDERRWDHDHTRSLAGSRVLIVGYGSIGAALGARLRACEAEVTGVARHPRPGEGVHGAADLDRLLASADVVVLVTPLTPDTAGLLDARRLALLPDGALVVNVGRGPVLDTAAMVAEAAAGRLRAALDVTDPEPLPAGHPLWACPGVIITPHVAGGAAAFYPQAARFVAGQIRRFAAGEPLANVVVPGAGG
jgi:phosphoglycerate dehydrogenase-like enzyme